MRTFFQILEVVGILIGVLSVPLIISAYLEPTPITNQSSLTSEAVSSSSASVLGVSDTNTQRTSQVNITQSVSLYIFSALVMISGFYFLKYKLEKEQNGIK